MIDTCKYLGVIVVVFITILIISRSLNWQANILKFMTLREGMQSDEDDDEEEEEEGFDPDDFRDKAKNLLDLLEEINIKHGTLYTDSLIGNNKALIQSLDYVKGLWDEEEDEWKEKAYSELAESKFVNYNKNILKTAKDYDKIIEKAETKESYKIKYDSMKKKYGETGVTYIKQGIGIVLNKEMYY